MDEFAAYATDRDISVSFNPTQGVADESYEDVIRKCDLIQVNERELEILEGRTSSAKSLATDGIEVIVTQGSDGCQLHSDGTTFSHPGCEVGEILDTVGAGDTFAAGFLVEWLNGEPPEECLATATAFGAHAVKQYGAPSEVDISNAQFGKDVQRQEIVR